MYKKVIDFQLLNFANREDVLEQLLILSVNRQATFAVIKLQHDMIQIKPLSLESATLIVSVLEASQTCDIWFSYSSFDYAPAPKIVDTDKHFNLSALVSQGLANVKKGSQ